MGPTRTAAPITDVVLVVTSSGTEVPAAAVPALLAAVQAQGVPLGTVTALLPEAVLPAAAAFGDRVHPVVHPGDARAALAGQLAGGARPVLVAAADVVASGPPLGALLDDARVRTGVLTAPATGGGTVDVRGGSVTGPGPRSALLGLVRVDGADRALAAAALDDPGVVPRADAGPDADVVSALVAGLVDAGVPVRAVPLGTGYVWSRPADPGSLEQARAAVGAVDEHAVRVRSAARGGDGFYSTFVLRRISPWATRAALRLGVTPNQATVASLALGLGAAALLAEGGRGTALVAAVLLQVCLVVDCVDGELARYRRRFSRFGAWLDATTDRVKEFAVILGLAAGAARGGDDGLWLLAAAAIALQTFRHLLDLGWALQREDVAPIAPVRPPGPRVWPAAEGPVRLDPAPAAGPGAAGWLRRIGHLPIGERFLLLSAGAALGAPRGTLVVLLGLGLAAAAYMLVAFAVRARPASRPAPRLLALADTGPLTAPAVRALAPRLGRAVALLPAAAAAAELVAVLTVAGPSAPGAWPAGAVLVAVVAALHYGRGYAVRERAAGPGVRPGLPGGPELRLTLVAVVCLPPVAGTPLGAPAGLWVLAAAVAAAAVRDELLRWRPVLVAEAGADAAPVATATGRVPAAATPGGTG